MIKQRVRGPNMTRSQNPNPPNDLQKKVIKELDFQNEKL